MELFLQRCFDGMFTGAIYASLAIALVMIYRSTGLLNFAQGEMATVSGYVSLALLTAPGINSVGFQVAGSQFLNDWLPGHPWPTWAAIVGAVIFGALLGAAIELLVMRRLNGRPLLSQVNVTIGLLIVLNGLTLQMWGPYAWAFPTPFPSESRIEETDGVRRLVGDFFEIAGARIWYSTLGVWLTLIVVMTTLALVVRKTRTGLAFRAITSNRESAALVGVPVARTLVAGWATAAGVGALAATLIGGAIVLEPLTMIKVLIYALAAATIGGLDSPGGAIIGGLIVGLTQSLAPGYLGIPTELSLLPPLGAMVLVLVLRPHGLFGTVPVARV